MASDIRRYKFIRVCVIATNDDYSDKDNIGYELLIFLSTLGVSDE